LLGFDHWHVVSGGDAAGFFEVIDAGPHAAASAADAAMPETVIEKAVVAGGIFAAGAFSNRAIGAIPTRSAPACLATAFTASANRMSSVIDVSQARQSRKPASGAPSGQRRSAST